MFLFSYYRIVHSKSNCVSVGSDCIPILVVPSPVSYPWNAPLFISHSPLDAIDFLSLDIQQIWHSRLPNNNNCGHYNKNKSSKITRRQQFFDHLQGTQTMSRAYEHSSSSRYILKLTRAQLRCGKLSCAPSVYGWVKYPSMYYHLPYIRNYIWVV